LELKIKKKIFLF